MKQLFFIVLACLVIIGCSQPLKKTRLATFTMVSTRNVDLSKTDNLSGQLTARGVTAKIWVGEQGYTNKKMEGSIQEVIDDALKKVGGDLMMNCVVYYITEDGKQGYMVEGDVFELPKTK